MVKHRRIFTSLLVAGAMTVVIGGLDLAAAQNANKFKARLAPAPGISIVEPQRSMQRTATAGIGSATATLSGRKLSVEGTFEKLVSPATEAHLFLGPMTGVRGGGPVFDLKVAPGTAGAINGSFDLSAEQVEALRKGRFYIQIHSQGAPTGHLLGWLLAEK